MLWRWQRNSLNFFNLNTSFIVQLAVFVFLYILIGSSGYAPTCYFHHTTCNHFCFLSEFFDSYVFSKSISIIQIPRSILLRQWSNALTMHHKGKTSMTKSVTDKKPMILIALLLRNVNTIWTMSKARAVSSARNRRNAEFCNQKEELDGTRMCTVRVGRSTASNRWRWRMKPFPSDLIGFRVWSSIIQFALDARWAIVYDTKREGTKGAGAHVFFNERAPSASYSRIDVPCQTWSRSIFWNHAYTVASQRLPMKTREEKGIFASWNAFFYLSPFFRGKGEIDETHFFGVYPFSGTDDKFLSCRFNILLAIRS